MCKNHGTVSAIWTCESCNNSFCDECIDTRLEACEECKGRCIAIIHEVKGSKPKSFPEYFKNAFSYPLAGHGSEVLIAGTIFFWIIDTAAYVVGSIGFLTLILVWILKGFTTCYLCAYMIKIIKSSSEGKDEAPEWPELGDILYPAFLVIGTFIISFLPVIVYRITLLNQSRAVDPLFFALMLPSILYFPMALTAVSLLYSINGAMPMFVVPSVFRVFRQYLIACTVFVIVFSINMFIRPIFAENLPLIGSIVNTVLSLYFLMVEMRILGLIFFTNKERLDWF